MALHSRWRLIRPRSVLRALAIAALLAAPVAVTRAQPPEGGPMRIGTSGTLSAGKTANEEAAALATLQDFIHTETGLKDEIVRQKDWQQLAEKMQKGQLQVGVFQGYEFAWAQEKYPDLKPLAVAVNVHTYPIIYVVTRRDDQAKDFAGLRGQTLALPAGSLGSLRLFIERESRAQGESAGKFFSRVERPANLEAALDDLVDGKVQAVVSDKAGLEAYKRRKPGRFAQLKPVAHSQPFPPTIVAYYNNNLDSATLQRFRDGLLRASQTDRGQTLLTLFRLTGFEAPPADLDQVLAKTRELEPPRVAAK